MFDIFETLTDRTTYTKSFIRALFRKEIQLSDEARRILVHLGNTHPNFIRVNGPYYTCQMGSFSNAVESKLMGFCDGYDSEISYNYLNAISELEDLGFLLKLKHSTPEKTVYLPLDDGINYGKRLRHLGYRYK